MSVTRLLSLRDANRLKRVLQFALDPHDMTEPAEVPTKVEAVILRAAIDRVTIKPSECEHPEWEWPMSACPWCGAHGHIPSDAEVMRGKP